MNQIPPPSSPGTFATRNWWRNGTACKVLVVGSILCLLNLAMPWRPDLAGTVSLGDLRYWQEYLSQQTAFHVGVGWILLPCLGLILWVCGRPRAATLSIRWLPLICVIFTFACAVEHLVAVKDEMDSFVANFFSTKPQVALPGAVMLVCLFSLPMAVAAWFFGRGGSASAK